MNPDQPINKNGITFASLSRFLNQDFATRAPVAECFCYHPPGESRKKKHEQINQLAKQSYDRLLKNCEEISDCHYWCGQALILDDLQRFAFEVCDDLLCIQWALRSIENMTNKPETMLMKLQQYRMFLNQGVTIDSLQQKVIG
jgi:hypothetical protein